MAQRPISRRSVPGFLATIEFQVSRENHERIVAIFQQVPSPINMWQHVSPFE
jgi:hypothetical protein